MSVTLDATGTYLSTGTSASSQNYTGITVGSGTNRALVVTLLLDNNGTSPTATWDSGGTNQAMTLLKSQPVTSGTGLVAIFGLVAPTSGNKTLHCAWTTAVDANGIDAVSFTGVDQTGGVTSFPNAAAATGNSATNSVTITSATGNAVMAVHAINASGNYTGTNNTQLFLENTFSNCNGAANRAAGAASVAMTATGASSGVWASVGTDIKAAGAAFIAGANQPVLQAVKRAAYW